jgi:hypothetical protein
MIDDTCSMLFCSVLFLRGDWVGERADRRREEVLAAPRGDERWHNEVVVRVEDVDAGHVMRRAIASLANDRVEAGRGVVLAEDEVGVVGPRLLLEGEAVGNDALVGNYWNG